MPKAVVIVLKGDIPSSEMGKAATVTIETRTYQGSVEVIAEYAVPATTTITLEGVGLKAATPAAAPAAAAPAPA